jgi:archaellum biogenesis protein FlaJ (TadC family)
MKSLFYSWMIFQMLVGIWMFISPFIFGYGETYLATNNMIFGAIVVILGVGTVFYEFYHRERFEKESFTQMEHAKERA